eukprot:6717765-Lingulodinium_polyedra.AAC.1
MRPPCMLSAVRPRITAAANCDPTCGITPVCDDCRRKDNPDSIHADRGATKHHGSCELRAN